MRWAADSSVLVRLYLAAEGADALERFLAEDAKLLSVSELAEVEVLNVLLRDPDLGAAARFEADLDEGARLRLEPVDWRDAFQRAESLARRFSRTLRPGGHDLVLVAAAVAMGATWFLSLDRNSRQRPLAAAAGLQVWPPLDKDEKGLVRHTVRVARG
jgi:predicted nucleic acid-binding protein